MPRSADHVDCDPAVDCYAQLGISERATPDEIKRAYRALARELHPDSTGGDAAKERRFKEVSAAYEVVGDATRRERYDALRVAWRQQASASPRRGSSGGPGTRGSDVPFGGLGDLGQVFDQFFGPGHRGDSFLHQMFGGSSAAGTRPSPQPRAESVRHESTRPPAAPGTAPTQDQPKKRSDASSGADRPSRRGIRTRDGAWLVAEGSGNVSSEIRISLEEAVVGTTRTVSTVDGLVELRVPPGTGGGARLRMRERGPRIRSRGRGDHYVVVLVDVPSAEDPGAADALEHLAARIRSGRR